MAGERLYIFSRAESNYESQPERQPDQKDIGEKLQRPFVASWKP